MLANICIFIHWQLSLNSVSGHFALGLFCSQGIKAYSSVCVCVCVPYKDAARVSEGSVDT